MDLVVFSWIMELLKFSRWAKIIIVVAKIFREWETKKPLCYFPMHAAVFISNLFSYLFIPNFPTLCWNGQSLSLLINKKQVLRGESFSYLYRHVLHDPEICSGNTVICPSLCFMSVCQGSHPSMLYKRKSTRGQPSFFEWIKKKTP